MTNTIENKWKRFAVCQVLSNWDGLDDATGLYDKLLECHEDDIPEMFSEYNISVWQPLECYDPDYVVSIIEDIAFTSQQVANSPE